MNNIGPWLSASVTHLQHNWRGHIGPALVMLGATFALVLATLGLMAIGIIGASVGGVLLVESGVDESVTAALAAGGVVLGYGAIIAMSLCFQPLVVGYVRFALLQYRGEEPTLHEFLWVLKRPHHVLGLLVIQSTLGMIATMLCYLPVFIVMAATFFAIPALVDRERGPIDALQTSWALAKPHMLELIALGVTIMLTSLLGMVPLIGMSIAVAFAITVQIVVYEDLRTRGEGPAPTPDSANILS